MKKPTSNHAEDLYQLTLRAMNGEKLSEFELHQAHLYSMIKVAWWTDVRDFLEGKESNSMSELRGVAELSSVLSDLTPEQIQMVAVYAREVRDENYSTDELDFSNVVLETEEENPFADYNLSIDPDSLLNQEEL